MNRTLFIFALLYCVANCDFMSDWLQLQNTMANVFSLDEQQLISKIKDDLTFVFEAMANRTTKERDIKVYLEFNHKIIRFYKEFRKDFEKMFAKHKEAKERKALLIRLSLITTTLRYDEEWRSEHFVVNTDGQSSSSLDQLQQKFRHLLLKLSEVLETNAERNYLEKKLFWYHFYSRLSLFYIKSYIEADIDANNTEDLRQKLVAYRVLNQEMERFLYLLALGSQPKTKDIQGL